MADKFKIDPEQVMPAGFAGKPPRRDLTPRLGQITSDLAAPWQRLNLYPSTLLRSEAAAERSHVRGKNQTTGSHVTNSAGLKRATVSILHI